MTPTPVHPSEGRICKHVFAACPLPDKDLQNRTTRPRQARILALPTPCFSAN